MNQRQAGRTNDTSPKRYNLPTFKAPILVLVEGPDEFHFLRFLQQREDIQIHVYEGKDQLGLELETIRGVEGFGQVRRVAIMRDADRDPKAAVQSVLSQWANAFKTPMPNVPSDEWYQDAEG